MTIHVERRVMPAEPGAAANLLARLDLLPGAWIGCDIDAEGMLHQHAFACVEPPLAFYLDGNRLRIVPGNALGVALAAAIAPLASFTSVQGRLELAFEPVDCAPHPLVSLLRQVLALFTPASSELAFYGALSFDFYRLERGDAVPDDGRRRVALFLPDRVLRLDAAGAQWVQFEFPGLHVDPAAVAAQIDPTRLERLVDDLAPGEHAQRVAIAIERMRQGDLYSLVLSQTLRRPTQVKPSAAFTLLRERNPYPAMFALNLGGGESVFGASPDLQVQADAQWIESAPVCGTLRRGADPFDDHEQARELMNSAKEEASLTICADSDRNDHATICVPGTVEHVARRRIHFFSTIVHTIDFIRGRRRPGVDAFDIVLAHATPPTVTGFPKPLARLAIEQIEARWRGWYAGAAVRIASDGSCEALTMLRFARVVDGIAEVRVGGALVVDADPAREEAETRLKAETLFRVLDGEPPVPRASAPAVRTTARVVVVDHGDPFGGLVAEALVRAGATLVDASAAEVEVVIGVAPSQATTSALPQLLIGAAAVAALAADGAAVDRLDPPRYGRRLRCQATSTGPLAARPVFELASYAAQAVGHSALPTTWLPWATASVADGPPEIAVAAELSGRRLAVLGRPEATGSARLGAGVWLIALALEWLRKHPDRTLEVTTKTPQETT